MAAAVTASFKYKGVSLLMKFEQSKRQLLRSLITEPEQEVLGYVLQEMQQNLGADAPSAPELRAFFQSPDAPTSLTLRQQVLAMDKLLEAAEVELRTLCDLIRYQQLKRLGIVHSVHEFIALFHSDVKEDQT